jgi:hypothetical protein
MFEPGKDIYFSTYPPPTLIYVSSLYQCLETRSIEVFWLLSQPLPHLVGHHLRLSNVLERISRRSCEPPYAINTSHRKQENFYEYTYFALSSFANKIPTTERCSSVAHLQARMPFWLLKPSSEHAHFLPKLSRSWTVLLPTDTHRKYIISITAVLLRFGNSLLTLPRIYCN